MSEILNASLSIGGASAGIYGAIRAWLANRKMKQFEKEKLAVKLNIDFNYELIESDKDKICHGIIKWSNMGLTNIKIIKLNIDARDRSKEMVKSYLPPENNPNSTLTPYSKKIENMKLVSINNHKLVNFSNNVEKGEVKIIRNDLIYGLELTSREKRNLRESGEEVDVDSLEMKQNITNYINNKVSVLKEKYLESDKNKEILIQFLFFNTLVKDLRGIQLFPEETREQEFFLTYEGEGIIYLNVETATIRLQLRSIDAIELYKALSDQIVDSRELTDSHVKKFKKILNLIILPAALGIHKQKSNFLIYLK